MLVAEVHGKIVPEAQNSEDYLTSAVFGHLRYVSPAVFWPELLRRTKGHREQSASLSEHLNSVGIYVERYTRIAAYFWPKHATLGEPDALIRFEGGHQPPSNMLIEAKLSAEKSGRNEKDQLGRYVQIMNDLRSIGVPVEPNDHNVLVYLTAKNSQDEIDDTLQVSKSAAEHADRIFRTQWQDVLKACQAKSEDIGERERTILNDVADFLLRRRLEYFEGFKRHAEFSFLLEPRPLFSKPFRQVDAVGDIRPRNCGWIS